MTTGAGYPTYRIAPRLLLEVAVAAATSRRRSFGADARRMLEGLAPALVIDGAAFIPLAGPGVITINHYSRPGFWAPWFAAAVSACVPGEVYWTVTAALTFPGRRLHRLLRWGSEAALAGIAHVYGFNLMPPMPPMPEEAAQRAAAVQRLARYLREHPAALAGLAPEGGDQPGGVLGMPPPGFGRLAGMLAGRGIPFYPVGAYEEDGRFVVRFGPAYWLPAAGVPAAGMPAAGMPAAEVPRAAQDAAIRRQVMTAIAALLPERLRGEFSPRRGRGSL